MANNNLSISVIVPVYNVDRLLPRCIDSILVQTVTPLEIILVDDGSPDSSGEICNQYAAQHDIIKVIHKPNGGLSSARKAGFQIAKGELIVFVDSDDYVATDYLEKLSSPMRDPEVQLSMCAYNVDDGNRIIPQLYDHYDSVIKQHEIAKDYTLPLIGQSSKKKAKNLPGFVCVRMYRTSLLHDSDFVSEREYFTEDVIMNIMYAKRIHGCITVVNEPLYYYCVNPGSLTLRYRERVFEMRMACNDLCRKLICSLPISAQEKELRLESNLVSAVSYSILNAARLAHYCRYRKELTAILNHHAVRDLFKNHKWPLKSTLHKIIYAAYCTKAYFILYHLLKTRKVL